MNALLLKQLLVTCLSLLVCLQAVVAQAVPAVADETRMLRQRDIPFDALDRVLNTQSRMVFYWQAGAAVGDAATIFVAGSYHATLTPGHHSILCLEPNFVPVGVRQLRASAVISNLEDLLELKPGETQYLRVNPKAQGGMTVDPVESTLARKELKLTREHSHTISRVQTALICQDLGTDAP